MAITVPVIQSQVSSQGVANFRQQPLQSTASESISQGLFAVSDVVGKIQREEKLKADRAAFMEADSNTDTVRNELLNTARQTQMKDAIGITPPTMEVFDKRTAEIAKGLKNKDQARAYQESVYQHKSQLQRELDAHESRQTNAYYTKSREDFKDQQHVNAVTVYNDPKAIEASIAKMASAVNQTPGLDTQQKTDEIAIRRSGIYAGVVERYLVNDELKDAERYYASVKDKVNGDQATKIENDIRIARDREQAKKQTGMIELRRSLDDQMRDNLEAASRGLPVNIPSASVLKAAFGENEGAQKHRIAILSAKASGDISALQQLPGDEIIKRVESYTPKQTEGSADLANIQQMVARGASMILKARNDDPAGYLSQHAPTTRAAWQRFQQDGSEATRDKYLSALDADRERLGLPPGDVLPNSYADALASALSNPKSSEQLATLMESEAQRWGDRWPDVYGQVAKNLPDMAAIIGSGIDRSAAVTLASTSKLKDKELQGMLPPNIKWGDVQADISSTFEDVRKSFPAEGARTWSAIQDSATRLAVSYMQAGDSKSNAIARAYKELVTKQYDFGEIHDVPFMVPREFNAGDIENEAATMLDTFEPPASMIAIPPGEDSSRFIERARNELRENAYFMQSGDGKGLRLYMNAQPTGVAVSFKELAERANARKAAELAASTARKKELDKQGTLRANQ